MDWHRGQGRWSLAAAAAPAAAAAVKVETTCMQLDDFLDYRHAAFTKTVVIFVSSYGVGQAPMGAQKFRSFAEELLSMVETETESGGKEEKNKRQLLKGLRYAICGLGTFVFYFVMLCYVMLCFVLFVNTCCT